MSRMAKKQLLVRDGVNICVDNGCVVVSGVRGTVRTNLGGLVSVAVRDREIILNLLKEKNFAMLGTAYILIKNAMDDVIDGFCVKLKMIGVGYKACVEGNFLRVCVGFSHYVYFRIPSTINVVVNDNVEISISGSNREDVVQFAKSVRAVKKPEPYKGKGIFYNDEKILMKEGKKK